MDDAREPETQIPGGGLKRSGRLRVAIAGARNDVLDRESLLLDGNRSCCFGRSIEIARDGGAVRYVGFPAASRAAGTAGAIERERNMSELPRGVVAPAERLAMDDDADAKAVGNADEDQVA